MKTLIQFINEAKSVVINAGKDAKEQFKTIQSYCSKRMYRKWKKSRTTTGDDVELYFDAKDLVETLGYTGDDLDCIYINIEKTNAHYNLQINFNQTSFANGDFGSANLESWVYCGKTYPLDSAKGLPEFLDDVVSEIFKDMDSLKAFVDENGKREN